MTKFHPDIELIESELCCGQVACLLAMLPALRERLWGKDELCDAVPTADVSPNSSIETLHMLTEEEIDKCAVEADRLMLAQLDRDVESEEGWEAQGADKDDFLSVECRNLDGTAKVFKMPHGSTSLDLRRALDPECTIDLNAQPMLFVDGRELEDENPLPSRGGNLSTVVHVVRPSDEAPKEKKTDALVSNNSGRQVTHTSRRGVVKAATLTFLLLVVILPLSRMTGLGADSNQVYDNQASPICSETRMIGDENLLREDNESAKEIVQGGSIMVVAEERVDEELVEVESMALALARVQRPLLYALARPIVLQSFFSNSTYNNHMHLEEVPTSRTSDTSLHQPKPAHALQRLRDASGLLFQAFKSSLEKGKALIRNMAEAARYLLQRMLIHFWLQVKQGSTTSM
ncbi:hypothetical protein AB1Y20_009437 [Prymnesium parvum]|uniref:Ubiquitin-like domain-containing protein n=1 Tax=Prymnesium parvum TaxID=97485 RepID=A0AB34K4R5_PRYPA